MIYLPVSNFPCYEIRDKDTIRAYHTNPAANITVNYTDYYINSHYLSKDGFTTFNQWGNNLPVCLNNSTITNDFYYRNDLDSILVIFLIISLVGFGIPLYLLKKLFRRL